MELYNYRLSLNMRCTYCNCSRSSSVLAIAADNACVTFSLTLVCVAHIVSHADPMFSSTSAVNFNMYCFLLFLLINAPLFFLDVGADACVNGDNTDRLGDNGPSITLLLHNDNCDNPSPSNVGDGVGDKGGASWLSKKPPKES